MWRVVDTTAVRVDRAAPVRPAGAQEITTAPEVAKAECADAEASLRPGPQPSPGAMPAGSTMAAIQERGRLIVGVDQNTFMFGYRDPASGQLEGFDIDLAREIARRIFGDPDRIELQVVEAGQRESALAVRPGRSGGPDLLDHLRTQDRTSTSPPHTSTRNQKILARKDSGIRSAADLSGKRVCSVSGTTSLKRVFDLNPRPTLIGVTSWTDCLLMLQQGQVDAVSTDDVVLKGLARQDPDVDVVGESMGIEPYGVGVKLHNDDLVRFVNGALEDIRADGTWERLYDRWLHEPRAVARPADGEVSGLMMNMLTLADISTKLVELESHPGLEHLRRYSPTGVTAQRWSMVEAALGQLWDDLAGLEELSDSDEIADCLERMNAAYPEVKEFLDAVDEINTTVAKRIAPAAEADRLGRRRGSEGGHRPVGGIGDRPAVLDDRRDRASHRRDSGTGCLPGELA